MSNVQRNEMYDQVCVWPGTIVAENEVESFVNFFKELGYRIQYLETIVTGPDTDEDGVPVACTGGRTDIFFAVHKEDVMRFAIPRLRMGIRWIEDVLDNEARTSACSIYPYRVKEYRTW